MSMILELLLWPLVLILSYYFSARAVKSLDKNLEKESES